MSEIVIKAESISKKYRLGVINRKELVDQIESWAARKMGRPDPHASVFEQATDRMPTPHDFWALKDVTFEIQKGDIVGVMGRNGSGKSTLLKLLSRITAPSTGRAFLRGRLASLLEVGTGFNYDLTGKENVYLNGSILGLKNKEICQRYDQIVEFAEISDFMDTPVKRYSSGMRVRLAFAVAAHLEPDILILDEVLAVGDAKFQEKCLNRISDIKKSGVTVLFVSHSAESVLQLCNKGLLLQEGKLIGAGDAKEITGKYLKSLHLSHVDPGMVGIADSRTGLLAGAATRIILNKLPNGSIANNCPVETPEGIILVDVGWISASRRKTLRMEPSWNGAPDLCILIASSTRPHEQLEKEHSILLKMGAREIWMIKPDGALIRCKPQGYEYLTDECADKIYY